MRVPASTFRFVDVAAEVGLAFTHDSGARGRFELPESTSGGGGFFDGDDDGDADVLLLTGAPVSVAGGAASSVHLYRNEGGRFTDVTDVVGLTQAGDVQTFAAADFDRDGDVDLAIAGDRTLRIYRNLGGGRFEDASAAVGLGEFDGYGCALAWIDARRDGFPDLVVGRYGRWSREIAQRLDCRRPDGSKGYCGPRLLAPHELLYLRNERGLFVDGSKAAGVTGHPTKALGMATIDHDGDGWPDLFVANDTVSNQLWVNRRDGTFAERGLLYGVGGLGMSALGGMGVDFADFQGNGRLCVVVGNFSGEPLTLHCQSSDGAGAWRHDFYEALSARAGLDRPSMRWVSFGLAFADLDLDGWPELLVANGHIDDVESSTGLPERQPLQLLAAGALAGGIPTYRDVTPPGGLAGVTDVGRALATADFDGDGDLDVLYVANDGPVRLLRNDTPADGRPLRVRLRGGPGAPQGLGAVVRFTAGGRAHRAFVISGGSYAGERERTLTIGLQGPGPNRVEVRWPDGSTESFSTDPSAKLLVLRKGEGERQGGPRGSGPAPEVAPDLVAIAKLRPHQRAKIAAARERLQALHRAHPAHPQIALALSHLRAISGDLPGARRALQDARDRDPDGLDVRRELAIVSWHLGDRAAAEAEVRAITQRVEGQAYLIGRLAVPLLDAGAAPLAEIAIDLAMKAAPGRPDPLVLKAAVQSQRGQQAAARAILARVLRSAPRHPRALTTLGYVALAEGKPEEAEASFRASLEVRRQGDEVVQALAGLGTAEAKQGRPREAAEHLLEASRKGKQGEMALAAASLFLSAGDDLAARAAVEQALSVDPHGLSALLLGAQLDEKLGRPRAALAGYRRVLEVAPNQQTAALGVQRLGRTEAD